MPLFVREGSIRKYTLNMEQKWLSLTHGGFKELSSLLLAAASSIPEPYSSMEFTLKKVA